MYESADTAANIKNNRHKSTISKNNNRQKQKSAKGDVDLCLDHFEPQM